MEKKMTQFTFKKGQKYKDGCFDPFKHLAAYQFTKTITYSGGVESIKSPVKFNDRL